MNNRQEETHSEHSILDDLQTMCRQLLCKESEQFGQRACSHCRAGDVFTVQTCSVCKNLPGRVKCSADTQLWGSVPCLRASQWLLWRKQEGVVVKTFPASLGFKHATNKVKDSSIVSGSNILSSKEYF